MRTKVEIICKIHGSFFQLPMCHLMGCDCPACDLSKGEQTIKLYLNKNYYLEEYRFKDCRDKNPLPFDFAIFEDQEKTKIKCLIEYDGIQHFKKATWFGSSDEDFEKSKKHDEIKNNYCLQNCIPLLRIPYWEFRNIDKILDNFINNITMKNQ